MKQEPSPAYAILKLLLKWWWLIAISVALGAGIGYMVRSRQPNIYFATATVLFGQNFEQGATPSWATKELITIYTGLVRRPVILDPVIEDLNLGITSNQLNGVMVVNQVQNLPLLEIIIANERPDRAANIANRIAQQLIDESPTEQVSQETEFKRAQLRDLQVQIEQLQAEYNAKIDEGATLTSAFEIAQNLAERTQILNNLRQLQQIYAEMSAGLQDQANSLRIFEFADPESSPVVSSPLINVVLSGVAGLVMSITTIILISYFDDRLQWRDGMESLLDLKVLGPLGVVPRSKLPLYIVTMPDAIESEVLRQLRANIVLAAGGVTPKMITVTSYDSGDGKTVTSANLALASANSGLRTLLIDGDMRKGNLHEIFRLPNVMGISDILAGHREMDALLSQTLLDSGYDNLSVLTSGRSNVDPGALLSSPRFAPLIERLKTLFDTIVMDSVPTIGGSDTAFMAEASDGVVIVVDSRRTTEKALKRTIKSLQQAQRVHILGVVFNRVRLQVTGTVNQPYYRRTLSLSPERLSRELLGTEPKRSLFGYKRNILTDRRKERFYSKAASALSLGISEDALNNWIKLGYLKTVRRGRRRWIRETDIQALLDRLPRHQPTAGELTTGTQVNGDLKDSLPTTAMPERLRDQRNALLDYAREPERSKRPQPEDIEDQA